MPVRGHVGSDYERLRPEFRVISNPWAPTERVMLVPPIVPDVALIHAIAATRDGTLLLDHMEDDALLAQASRTVVASAERIVDRKSTRLNSSHTVISYAVFCLKKKKKREQSDERNIKK